MSYPGFPLIMYMRTFDSDRNNVRLIGARIYQLLVRLIIDVFPFSIFCVYELCAVREGLTKATGRTFTGSESWCQKKRKNNNVSLDLNGKRLARLFKEWRVCSTPCHTLSRVLSLASMYSFFIRSAQFHLPFFLCSFLIRKVTCSAGKFLYILLSILSFLYVFRFGLFPSQHYFWGRQGAFS